MSTTAPAQSARPIASSTAELQVHLTRTQRALQEAAIEAAAFGPEPPTPEPRGRRWAGQLAAPLVAVAGFSVPALMDPEYGWPAAGIGLVFGGLLYVLDCAEYEAATNISEGCVAAPRRRSAGLVLGGLVLGAAAGLLPTALRHLAGLAPGWLGAGVAAAVCGSVGAALVSMVLGRWRALGAARAAAIEERSRRRGIVARAVTLEARVEALHAELAASEARGDSPFGHWLRSTPQNTAH